jgi:hypothetical protein
MAHDCPECGQLCHCGGDIDDCCLNDDDSVNRCTHCETGPDIEDDDPEGCCYPDGQCCMPGPHRMSECHTAEMIAEQFAANMTNPLVRRCMYSGFNWRLLGIYGNRGLERIGKTILCAMGLKTFVHPRSYRKANASREA